MTALGMLAVSSGCSTGAQTLTEPVDVGSSAPGETVPPASSPASVTAASASAVSAEPEMRLGSGRAVAAMTRDSTTVVVTTTGVFVGDAAASSFERLDSDLAHEGPDVELASDASALTLLGTDGHLEVWSLGDQPEARATFDEVRSVAFDVDGTVVVAEDSSLRRISTADGAIVAETHAPAGRTLGGAAIAAGGRVLAPLLSDTDPEVLSWSGGSGANADVFGVGSESVVDGVVAVPSSERVAVGLLDRSDPFSGSIAMVDAATGEVAWSVEADGIVDGSNWDLTGEGGLVVADESTIRFVDPDGVETDRIDLPTPVRSMTAAPGAGRGAVVLLADGTVERVDRTGVREPVALGADPSAEPVAALDAAAVISAVTSDGLVVVFDGDDAVETERFVAGAVNDVAVDADGRIASAGSNGAVTVVDPAADGGGVATLVHPEGNVDSVSFSPSGDRIVTGVSERRAATAFDDTVSFWDPEGAERVGQVGGEAEDVAGCSFFRNVVRYSHDASFVTATSHDFTVSMIDADDASVIHTFAPHANTVLDTAISPDDRLLVTSADDSTMRVWDLESKELIADHQVTMGGYWSMSFLPDGTSLVVGDLAGNMSIIDAMSGDTLLDFDGTKLRHAATAVSPDGRLVAAGADDSTVRVWSTETGAVLGEFAGHDAPVTSVVFSDDGEHFVTGSQDATTIVWRYSTA